jgi:hypothetical protein
MARTRNAEIGERRGRLERTEARIAGLVKFISEGDHSVYIRSTLLDLKAQAKTEKQAIGAILREVAQPIRLPSPGELERMVYELESRNRQDVLVARELLRRILKNGRIVLEPQANRVYLSPTDVLPLLLLSEGVEKPVAPGSPQGLPFLARVAGARYLRL